MRKLDLRSSTSHWEVCKLYITQSDASLVVVTVDKMLAACEADTRYQRYGSIYIVEYFGDIAKPVQCAHCEKLRRKHVKLNSSL